MPILQSVSKQGQLYLRGTVSVTVRSREGTVWLSGWRTQEQPGSTTCSSVGPAVCSRNRGGRGASGKQTLATTRGSAGRGSWASAQ